MTTGDQAVVNIGADLDAFLKQVRTAVNWAAKEFQKLSQTTVTPQLSPKIYRDVAAMTTRINQQLSQIRTGMGTGLMGPADPAALRRSADIIRRTITKLQQYVKTNQIQLGVSSKSAQQQLSRLQLAYAQLRKSMTQQIALPGAANITGITQAALTLQKTMAGIVLMPPQVATAPTQMAAVQSAFGNFGKSIVAVGTSLGGLLGWVRNTVGGFDSLRRLATGLSIRMFYSAFAIGAVTESLRRLFQGLVETGGEVDRQARIYKATTQATDEATKAAMGYATTLAVKMATPITDTIMGLTALNRAGLDQATSLTVLKPVFELAIAGQIKLAEASQFAANLIRIFNLSAAEVPQVLGELINAAVGSAAEIKDMVEAFRNAVQVTALFPVSARELAVTLGLVANQGLIGARAGTSLMWVYRRLSGETAEAQEILDELGVSLFDQQGQVKGLEGVFTDLSKALVGTTDAQREHILSTLFGRFAMSAASRLLKLNAEDWANMRTEVDKTGRVQELVDAELGSVPRLLDAVGVAFEAIRAQGFGPFSESLSNLLKGFISLLLTVTQLPPELSTFLITVVGGITAFGIFTTTLFTFLAVLGTLLASLGTLGPIIGGIALAFGGAAAAAGMMGLAWMSDLWGLREDIETLFKGIVGDASDWGYNLVKNLVLGFFDAIPLVVDAITAITEAIAGFLAPGSPPKTGPLATIDRWGGDLMNMFLKGFKSADFELVSEAAQVVRTYLESAVVAGLQTAKQASAALADFYRGLLAGLQQIRTTGESISSLLQRLSATAVGPFTQAFKDYVTSLWEANRAMEQLAAAQKQMADLENRHNAQRSAAQAEIQRAQEALTALQRRQAVATRAAEERSEQAARVLRELQKRQETEREAAQERIRQAEESLAQLERRHAQDRLAAERLVTEAEENLNRLRRQHELAREAAQQRLTEAERALEDFRSRTEHVSDILTYRRMRQLEQEALERRRAAEDLDRQQNEEQQALEEVLEQRRLELEAIKARQELEQQASRDAIERLRTELEQTQRRQDIERDVAEQRAEAAREALDNLREQQEVERQGYQDNVDRLQEQLRLLEERQNREQEAAQQRIDAARTEQERWQEQTRLFQQFLQLLQDMTTGIKKVTGEDVIDEESLEDAARGGAQRIGDALKDLIPPEVQEKLQRFGDIFKLPQAREGIEYIRGLINGLGGDTDALTERAKDIDPAYLDAFMKGGEAGLHFRESVDLLVKSAQSFGAELGRVKDFLLGLFQSLGLNTTSAKDLGAQIGNLARIFLGLMIVSEIAGLFSKLGGFLGGVWGLVTKLPGAWQLLLVALNLFRAHPAVLIFSTLALFLADVVKRLFEGEPLWDALLHSLQDLLSPLRWVVDRIGDFVGWLGHLLGLASPNLLTGVTDGIKDLGSAIRASPLGQFVNWLGDLLNVLGRVAQFLTNPGAWWGALMQLLGRGGGGHGLTEMATGGIVTRPTRTLLGEAGPEAVLPLTRLGGLLSGSFGSRALAGIPAGGPSVIVNYNAQNSWAVPLDDAARARITQEVRVATLEGLDKALSMSWSTS